MDSKPKLIPTEEGMEVDDSTVPFDIESSADNPLHVNEEGTRSLVQLSSEPIAEATLKNRIFAKVPKQLRPTLHLCCSRPALFLFTVLVIVTLVDLLVFYLKMKSPSIQKMELFLESDSADVQLTVAGQMQTASLTTSASLNDGKCYLNYKEADTLLSVQAGEIDLSIPEISSNQFNVAVSLRNSNYASLRRIYWDITNALPANSSLSIDCAVSVTALFYQILPVSVTVPFSQVMFIRDLQRATHEKKHDGEESVIIGPMVQIEPQSVSMQSIKYNILANIRSSKSGKVVFAGSELESFCH